MQSFFGDLEKIGPKTPLCIAPHAPPGCIPAPHGLAFSENQCRDSEPLGNTAVMRARTTATLAETVATISALGRSSLGRSRAILRTRYCLSLTIRIRTIVCAVWLSSLPFRLSGTRPGASALLGRGLCLRHHRLHKQRQNEGHKREKTMCAMHGFILSSRIAKASAAVENNQGEPVSKRRFAGCCSLPIHQAAKLQQ